MEADTDISCLWAGLEPRTPHHPRKCQRTGDRRQVLYSDMTKTVTVTDTLTEVGLD